MRACVATVLAAVATAFVAPAPNASAGSTYHRCGGAINLDGTIGEYGMYREIEARRVSCSTARQIISIFATTRPSRLPQRVGQVTRVRLRYDGRRWSCRAVLRQGETNPYETARCKSRGGRRVRFVGAS